MPIEAAKEFYGEQFDAQLEDLMSKWYVYSDPTLFVMAYPYSTECLARGEMDKMVDKPDCWFIHFFSGDMMRLFEIAPMQFPHVAFQRNNGRVKVYDVDKIKKKLGR